MKNIEMLKRPDHPDYWAISRTLIAHDEVADNGGFIVELHTGMDEGILMDLALLKGTNGVQGLADHDSPMMKMMTMWVMGFSDGVRCCRGLDASLTKADFQNQDLMGIDGMSITYAAQQRAIRALMETDWNVPAAAASWLDGFVTGFDFDTHNYPQNEADARVCRHGNRYWWGHECGLCEDEGLDK